MGKGAATASIVLLIGTSTAGKGTICNEIKRQNDQWKTYGHDELFDDLHSERDERFLNELKDDARFKEIARLLPKDFAARKLYQAIQQRNFEYQGKIIDLLDEEKFNEKIAEFSQASDREILQQLRSLALEKNQKFQDIFKDVYGFGEENPRYEKVLFDKAIASSKAGVPMVLDLTPDNGRPSDKTSNIVDRFEKYCAEQNHQCPIHVALLHLPVKHLEARIEGRNTAAIARGDDSDVRQGIGPLTHYVEIFGPASGKEGEKIVGEIAAKDVNQMIAKFSRLGREGNTDAENKNYQEQEDRVRARFGFDKKSSEGASPTMVVAISPFDRVYDVTSRESTAEVAKKIINLGTDKSITPSEKHPIAAILQERQSFLDGSQDKSFVEKMGLKPRGEVGAVKRFGLKLENGYVKTAVAKYEKNLLKQTSDDDKGR